MFLLNSRSALVTAAGSLRRPFSRSYGANLPSSLAGVLSNTWVSSTCLPVSDCGTGGLDIRLGDFLGGPPPGFASPEGSTRPPPSHTPADFPAGRPGGLTRTTNGRARGWGRVPPSLTSPVTEYQPCVHRLRRSASP